MCFQNKIVSFEKLNSFMHKMVRGFKFSKEGFESLKNILAIGKGIRITQRGIRIAKVIFQSINLLEKGFESQNRGFESLNPEIHEYTRKCLTNIHFYTQIYHTQKFIKHGSSYIIHINHTQFSSNLAKLILIQRFG